MEKEKQTQSTNCLSSECDAVSAAMRIKHTATRMSDSRICRRIRNLNTFWMVVALSAIGAVVDAFLEGDRVRFVLSLITATTAAIAMTTCETEFIHSDALISSSAPNDPSSPTPRKGDTNETGS